jgi:hypothetical protein
LRLAGHFEQIGRSFELRLPPIGRAHFLLPEREPLGTMLL